MLKTNCDHRYIYNFDLWNRDNKQEDLFESYDTFLVLRENKE